MEIVYQLGDTIKSKYRIVSILGQGGTAITYEAEDIKEDRLVAIKVLSLQQTIDWKIIELFEREAQILANLNYSKIPKYIDYFHVDTIEDRRFHLVQELIPGQSLASLVAGGYYFQEAEVKNIAQQVLEILNYLHNLNPPVIHRDIKPHNIIQTDRGEIYLVDLGAVQDVYRNTLTRSGTFVGTIDYMPPEQMRGEATFASDIYSLGCTLLYLLTRRSPLDLPLQRMKLNFRDSLSISVQFADWLDIAIAPDPEDRFNSTQEAIQQLNSSRILEKQHQSKLVGSSVIVTKTNNELVIKIPPQISQEQLITFLMLALPIIMFVYLLLNINFNFQLFFIFCILAYICSCTLILFIIFKILFFRPKYLLALIEYDLKVNRESFEFKANFCGIKRKKTGKTTDLKKVDIFWTKNYLLGENKAEGCVIRGRDCCYRFGRLLTRVEQEWLAEEITGFIERTNL